MNDYYREISDHAHAVPQQEVCGFLHSDEEGSLRVSRCSNTAHNPAERFSIAAWEQYEAIKRGRLVAYYHSHWETPPDFSEEDITRSNTARLPLFCYSTFSKTFNLHKPTAAIAEYEGRMFMLGFQDCFSIISDWYQKERNKTLPYFMRPETMLTLGNANFPAYMEAHGFERRHFGPYERGDVLVFSVMTENDELNHGAVMMDSENMLHQLTGQKSTVVTLNPSWSRRVRMAFREKIQR